MAYGDKTRAQVHRFRERVAVYIGDGQTVYLNPKTARKLARALNACAKSCQLETFMESNFGTVEIEGD